MPIFHIRFDDQLQSDPDESDLEFVDLEQAYLGVCAAIPGMATDLLLQRRDPLRATCTIADAKGRVLMTVPFTDVLTPSEWRIAQARRRPQGGPRSTRTRDDLALQSFRRMFSSVAAGCVLMTPEMRVVEMNRFGAIHSHVDAEEIRGSAILDIFADLKGKPKADFTAFMALAEVGGASEVVDLPYLVLDEEGQTTQGWWTARTWPIFDDDGRILGLVEWAEPSTRPTRGGITQVRPGLHWDASHR